MTPLNRRRFLKVAGTGVGRLALAGDRALASREVATHAP
jgi:hypothetical protein